MPDRFGALSVEGGDADDDAKKRQKRGGKGTTKPKKKEAEVEKRIDQMKNILEFKEATIEELRSRLNRANLEGAGMGGQDPQSIENVAMLTKALRERDEQIEQLQESLSQASR